MAVWRNIELDWQGETFVIKPTLEFIAAIESRPGHSLSQLFIRTQARDLPVSMACRVISDALRYAGAKVSPDDVFEATGGLSELTMRLATTIIVGSMPEPDEDDKTTKKKKISKS